MLLEFLDALSVKPSGSLRERQGKRTKANEKSHISMPDFNFLFNALFPVTCFIHQTPRPIVDSQRQISL